MLLECEDTPQCFDMVVQRKVGAWLVDDILLYSTRAAAPQAQTYVMVGKFLSIEPLTVMMRRGDMGLKKLVDA